MARSQLKKLLLSEAQNYLGIPYFINLPYQKKSNLYSGKATWQQIKKISTDYHTLKKAKIGIDCSGLVYHLLDFISQHLFQQPASNHLVGTNNQNDARHLSADLLTSPPNAIKTNSAQPGDLIRSKNGHHVALVLASSANQLTVIDSSRQGRGVNISHIPWPLPSGSSLHRPTFLQSIPGT